MKPIISINCSSHSIQLNINNTKWWLLFLFNVILSHLHNTDSSSQWEKIILSCDTLDYCSLCHLLLSDTISSQNKLTTAVNLGWSNLLSGDMNSKHCLGNIKYTSSSCSSCAHPKLIQDSSCTCTCTLYEIL